MAVLTPVEVRDELAAQLDELAELTRRLVAIDSPTDAPAGVAAVLALLGEALRDSGCAVQRIDVGGGLFVLDATLDLGPGPTVLILGHADTVWPEGTVAEWGFERRDGRWRGPGVGDMKACLVVAVHALRVIAARRDAYRGRVRLLVIPDEEAGSVRSRAVIEAAAASAAACLTLEAARAGGGLVTSRAAVGAMRIEVDGEACHVTDPPPHRDALAPLVALAASLSTLGTADATARLGVLRAGTARQLVPEHALALIDLRADSTAAGEALADAIGRQVQSLASAAGVEATITGGITRPAFVRTAATAALYAEAAAAATLLDQPLCEVAERGGSDASFPAALGVPTLDGLGPICHASCSREEWIEESSIAVFGALLVMLTVGRLEPSGAFS